jgi:hypothetical protein
MKGSAMQKGDPKCVKMRQNASIDTVTRTTLENAKYTNIERRDHLFYTIKSKKASSENHSEAH